MSRFLIRALKVTGALALCVLLAPNLIILGAIALILPGLILAVTPTAFLYLALFSLGWFGLRRHAGAAPAALAGAALAAAVGAGVPAASNLTVEQRVAAARARDKEPPAPVAPAGVVGLVGVGEAWRSGVCNDLCLLLLANGQARAVIVAPRPDAPAARGEPTTPVAFRLAPARDCAPLEAGVKNATAWTKRTPDILKALRARAAAGECLLSEPAGDLRPELVVRRLRETLGARAPDFSLAPGAVTVAAIEIERDGVLLARRSAVNPASLVTPLSLEPYGSGISLDHWRWARTAKWQEPLDVAAALQELTSLDLATPGAGGLDALRASVDALLAEADDADHPALQIVGDYFEALRNVAPGPEEAERLVRLLGDDRVKDLWRFPRRALAGADAPRAKDVILDRMMRLQGQAANDAYRALDQLAGALPPASFATADPRVETLLADVAGRARSPQLVERLADAGPAAAPRLVRIMEEGWTAPPPDRRRRGRDDGGAVAALRGLCRIAPDASDVLPSLRALEDAKTPPPSVLEGDLWRGVLVRLGVDPAEYEKPASRGGDVEAYRRRLASHRCDR